MLKIFHYHFGDLIYDLETVNVYKTFKVICYLTVANIIIYDLSYRVWLDNLVVHFQATFIPV